MTTPDIISDNSTDILFCLEYYTYLPCLVIFNGTLCMVPTYEYGWYVIGVTL